MNNKNLLGIATSIMVLLVIIGIISLSTNNDTKEKDVQKQTQVHRPVQKITMTKVSPCSMRIHTITIDSRLKKIGWSTCKIWFDLEKHGESIHVYTGRNMRNLQLESGEAGYQKGDLLIIDTPYRWIYIEAKVPKQVRFKFMLCPQTSVVREEGCFLNRILHRPDGTKTRF